MTRCATSAVLFALALFSLAQPAAVPAVVLTWNVAGGGNWDTTSPNWSGDATVFPDDATADVVFNNTAGGTIAIASNMTPASVTVSAASGTYTFTGGPIDGAGGLTKSGDGLLVINSANSFTGTTTINYGRITISHAGALGLGGGNITAVGSNGNNGSLLALTGGITVNGALRLQAISSGRASLINAGGSNVWAGTIDITGTGNHAMLQVDSGSLTVTGDITGTLTSGNFYIRGSGTSRITGSININSNLNKRDGGTWIIGNTTTPKTYSWNATNVELGVLGFAAANIHPATRVLTLGSDQSGSAVFMLGDGTTGYNQTVAGLVTGGVTATRKIVGGGSNVATLTVNNSGTYTFNGTLGGTGTNENNLALKKTGTAELTLGGHNTYTGVTTVERGRLTITHANALGSTAGGTILAGVADGGEVTLVISGGITVAEPLHLSASVQRANLQNGPGDNTWAGPIDITSAGSQQPMIYSSTNGTLTVTGDISGANTPNFYIRGTGTTDNWLRGSINITGRLFKRDTGTWMLGDPNGAETYSWLSTTVEAGILKFAAANVHPASAVLTLDTNQGQPATFMLGNGTTGYNQTVAGLVTGGTNDTRKIVGGGANVATLTVNNSANYTYSGTLGGTGTHENNLALTKSGSGSLTLSGATPNTYAGLTTVSGGTFILAKSTGVDAVGGDVTVSGGTLQWNQDHQLPDTATLIQTGGTIAFSGMDETLANFTKSGGTTQTGGNSAVITITETFSLSGGTTFNFNSPSTIVANRMLHTGGIITLGASGTLLDIGPGGLEMTGSTITLNPGS
ncbi:MAG: autotransporter-associated beta strand repeat-containing protein, partial [Patescibacteria group bacterium]|nr:autotransporter-associated beta strand repeat-containing protein [Patescibacteria group bacterium]